MAKVFILQRDDTWGENEIVGVFVSLELAKEFAEKEEPLREFSWKEAADGFVAFYWALSANTKGPIYTYSVMPFEVREK